MAAARFLLLVTLALTDPALAAARQAALVRINFERYWAISYRDLHVYLSASEDIKNEKKISRSFCSNHLGKEDEVVTIREDQIELSDDEWLDLKSRCINPSGKNFVPPHRAIKPQVKYSPPMLQINGLPKEPVR